MAIGGGWRADSGTYNNALTPKLSPELSPNTLRLKLTRLKPLKIVERVKGFEPSLSAWEPAEGLLANQIRSVNDRRGRTAYLQFVEEFLCRRVFAFH